MTARAGSRQDYRHFPPEYADLLRSFGRNGHANIGPMSEKEARASARDLYRFKMFLTRACDEDADDPYARELLAIFTDVTIRVEPVATHDPRGSHCVTFALNPIVAAVRQMMKGDRNGSQS